MSAPSAAARAILMVVAAPSIIDSAVRLLLFARSRRSDARELPVNATRRILVTILARDEGDAVHATLLAARAASNSSCDLLLLLDGADDVAESIASSLGIETLTKSPAGPTKAAALAWLATNERLIRYEGLLIVDTGSALAPGFFDNLTWPAGYDAMQSLIAGAGGGAGEAAAASERWAQRYEDAGRIASGWNARLRGTGMLISRDAFRDLVPRLRTRVEDWELSLLLGASGRRIGLATGSVVIDEKPLEVAAAARQRSRWLAGQLTLPFVCSVALVRYVLRRPFEGLAFAVEILSRPRTFSALLRVLAATALLVTSPSRWTLVVAVVALVSVATDAALFLTTDRASLRSASALAAAWVRAVGLLPVAFAEWLKVRRR